jgi:uncharacterized repeat protein (TIGR01451 family)
MGRRLLGAVFAVLGALFAVQLLPGSGVGATHFTGDKIYVSTQQSGTVDGVSFTGGDILVYDSAADTWAMFFDGSDVLGNLRGANIDGFHIADFTPGATVIHLSGSGIFKAGLGLTRDADVVTFTGTTGSTTFGTFAEFIDGSEVGLTSGGEDVDAVAATEDGWALSLLGSGRVTGLADPVPNEDLIEFSGSTGPSTIGSFTKLFDASDVGLGGAANLSSASIDPDTGQIFVTNFANYSIGELDIDQDDILVYTGTTGEDPSGTLDVYFNGENHRFPFRIDGLHIERGDGQPPAQADLQLTVTADPAAVAIGDTVTFDVTVQNNGPDDATNVVVANTLPPGLTFESTAGCALDPDGLPCSLGDLANGENASFTITATANGDMTGTIANQAEATSSTADPDPTNDSDSAEVLVAGPPRAFTDEPASNSQPGDPFHAPSAGTYSLAAPGVLANDQLGFPEATVTSFGGESLGGDPAAYNAGETASFAAGSLTINADGSIEYTPANDFEGALELSYRLQNPGGASDGKLVILVGPRPVIEGGDLIYVSTALPGIVDGISFDDEDILVYDRTSDTWAMHVDGSDVGLTLADVNGFAIEDDGTILFSLAAPFTVPGVGPTDDSDVIAFTPSSTGDTTAGTFAMHVDGTDLLLTAGGEDIDAVTEVGGGDLAISTWGSHNVPGAGSGADEDLIELNLTGTGPATSGNPADLFDGSAVGLAAEDISGASMDGETGALYLSNFGPFNLPGISGDGDDIILFTGTTGATTSGSFSTFFAGEAARFDNNQIDGLHVSLGQPTTNNPPEFTGPDSGSVPESRAGDGIDVEATDPDGDTEGAGLTFSFGGGPDDGLFEIKPNTGAVLFLAEPDYENPADADGDNIYRIVVRVTDSGGLSATRAYNIEVTNVVEDATIGDFIWNDLNRDGIQQSGEPGVQGVVVRLLEEGALLSSDVTDGDGRYEFVVAPGAYELELNFLAGPGSGLAPFAAGTDNTVDSDFDPLTGAATVTVGDDETNNDIDGGLILNQAPVITTPGPFSVAENSTGPAADIDATDDFDSEAGGTLLYSLASGDLGGEEGGVDNGLFNIDPATGVITFQGLPPDYENPQDANGDNDYELRVRVTDDNGVSTEQDIIITVTDEDDQSIVRGRVWDDLNENGIQDEGEPGVIGVRVNLATPGNNELQSNFFFTDTETDELGEYSFTVDAGEYELAFLLPFGREFTIQGAGTDPALDSDADPVDGTFGPFTVAVGGSVDNIDAGLIDANEAPVITTSGPFDVIENTVGSIDIDSTDDTDSEANGTLTYRLGSEIGQQNGSDNALFDIDTATGVVTFRQAPDYENPVDQNGDNSYDIRVEVTDSDGASSSANYVVNVTNVVEQATLGDFVWQDVNEDGLQTPGEPGFSGADVVLSDASTFAEVARYTTGGDGLYSFTVDPGTYVVTLEGLSAGAGFTTPEAGTDRTIDSDFSQTFPFVTVTLADDEVNDTVDAGIVFFNTPPTLIVTEPFSIAENETVVVDLDASDDSDSEAAGTLTYSIFGGVDGALFSIDAQSGVLSFIDPPDYENPADDGGDNGYQVLVQITDSDNASSTYFIDVNVTDVVENQAPMITGPDLSSAIEVPERQVAVATLTATDDGPAGDLVFSIKNNGIDDGALFDIDPVTGVVTFKTAPDFENPGDTNGNNLYNLVVEVTDAFGLFDEELMAVRVTDVAEDPVFVTGSSHAIDEGETFIVDVDATDDIDSEAANTLTFGVELNGVDDGALLTIDPQTGELSFLAAPDYENPGDTNTNNTYSFIVEVTDTENNTTEQVFVVTVNNVIEAGTIGDRVWDDSNQNGVQNGSEPGRDGVTVNLIDGTDGVTQLDTATTTGGGLYSFTVNPGDYIIEIEPPAGTQLTTQGAGTDLTVDSDPDPATGQTATVTIGDDQTNDDIDAGLIPVVNQAPVITTPGPFSADENQTSVTDLEATDDSDSEATSTLTWSIIGGFDFFLFNIDASTGVLTFKDQYTPDFEAPVFGGDTEHEVTVRVTDSAGASTTADLIININDVDEGPVANDDFRGTDADTAIVAPAAVTPVASFGDTGTAAGEFDGPADVVELPDGTLAISDLNNDRLQLCDRTGSCTVLGTSGTAVGEFDAPVGLNLTDSGELLIADRDNGRLQTCTAAGVCNAVGSSSDFPPPVEAVETATGTFIVTSAGGPNKVNECAFSPFSCTQYAVPSSSLFHSGLAIAPNGDLVGSNIAPDSFFVCAGSNDCQQFGGAFTEAGSFDNPGDVEVTPADTVVFADTINARIVLCDRAGNCRGYGSFGSGPGQFTRTGGVGLTADGEFVVTDPVQDDVQILDPGGVLVNDFDPEGQALTVTAETVTSSEGAAVEIFADGSYTYDPSGSATLQALAVGETIDDTFTYTVSDGTFTDTATVIIRVRGTAAANAAPVIDNTPLSASVAENQTAAIDVDTTDDSDDETGGLTYSLSGGDDAGLFSIDSGTGVISFDTAPNFENPLDVGADNSYELQVTVTDSGNLTDVEPVTITVTNLVEQATIGDLVWNDTDEDGVQDGGETGQDGVVVNLIDGNDGTTQLDTTTTAGGGLYSFTVNPGLYIVEFVAPSGTVFTVQGAGIDLALDSDADETTGRTGTITVVEEEVEDTIDAGLVPEPTGSAPVITPPGPLSVDENTTFVVDLETTDDADVESDGLTYSIIGGIDEEAFIIDELTGELTFSEPPDHEFPWDAGQDNTYVVTVRVTDTSGLTDEITLTVTVNDVYETATIAGYVWDDVNGDGIQAGPEFGIDGVAVQAYDTLEGFEWDSTVTADGGYYEFTDLIPSSYEIRFTLPSGKAFTVRYAGTDTSIDSNADPATGASEELFPDEGDYIDYIDAGLIPSP